MRIAIVSDIHGNMEAFLNVLSDIDRSDVDTIISLGDTIGYGPEPDNVLNQIQKLGIISIMGNHELAVADKRALEFFNPQARQSIQMTLDLLSERSLDYIYRLDPFTILHGYRFVHGLPPGSITTYLFQVTDDRLQAVFNQYREPLCFIGHTHTLELVACDGKNISRESLREGTTSLNSDFRYIINSGSVGQPRDLNNNAKYIILDTDEYHLEVRYIPYNIAAVVDKIIAAGLPKGHATRLW
jgi:predicted phosphodiesterase